jgi:Fe-S cluster biogenesis protein NfuA
VSAVHLHPEKTSDPSTMRWVADTAALPDATTEMRALLDDGTLVALKVDSGEIRTTLAADQTWADVGGRVRTVLFQALSAARTASLGDGVDDEGWYAQVDEVLQVKVAPFVDSHGGQIRIESLTADTLTVSLGGTCGHCTLRTTTLRNVVAGAVQARFPQIREIRAVRV